MESYWIISCDLEVTLCELYSQKACRWTWRCRLFLSLWNLTKCIILDDTIGKPCSICQYSISMILLFFRLMLRSNWSGMLVTFVCRNSIICIFCHKICRFGILLVGITTSVWSWLFKKKQPTLTIRVLKRTSNATNLSFLFFFSPFLDERKKETVDWGKITYMICSLLV